MDAEKFNKIKVSFERKGKIIDQSDDMQRYLDFRGAEGITFNAREIGLRKQPTTSSVFEELIHATQHRTGKFKEFVNKYGNKKAELLLEIEANEKLVRFAKQYNIPEIETMQTKKNLKFYRETLKNMD